MYCTQIYIHVHLTIYCVYICVFIYIHTYTYTYTYTHTVLIPIHSHILQRQLRQCLQNMDEKRLELFTGLIRLTIRQLSDLSNRHMNLYIRFLKRASQVGTPKLTNSWLALCHLVTLISNLKATLSSVYIKWLTTVLPMTQPVFQRFSSLER